MPSARNLRFETSASRLDAIFKNMALCPLIGQWRVLANQRRLFINQQALANKRVHWSIFRSLTNHLVYCQINVFSIAAFISQKPRIRTKTKRTWKFCNLQSKSLMSFRILQTWRLKSFRVLDKSQFAIMTLEVVSSRLIVESNFKSTCSSLTWVWFKFKLFI